MLQRSHRFHGHNSLRYVYQHGRTVRGTLLAIKYAANDRRDTYRCAVVVSKKISKSAVVRNRIRRRIYETVRNAGPITGPADIVITVFQASLATLPADSLNKAVTDLLKQAKLI